MRLVALLALFTLIAAPVAPDAVLAAAPTCFPQDGMDAPKQDEPKKEEPKQDEPQEIELEIVVGKRPASADGVPQAPANFKLKEPLVLNGISAKDRALQSAVARGLQYLIDTQQDDGTWKFEPKVQIREEVPQKERYFQMTAQQTLNKVVTTSFVCMALRAHEELAPERIRAAVAKALPYVIENAPKHKSTQYEVWTWSLSIEFMVAEYGRARDEELKAKLRQSVHDTVEKLCTGQRKGAVKVPAVLPKTMEKAKEEVKKEKGYFGVTPVAEEGSELPGIRIQQVQKGSPAERGGIKNGDRIMSINDVRMVGIEQLYETVAGLIAGETARVKVLRGAKAGAAGRRGGGMNLQDGGWGYYNWTESATNCTATALLALEKAKTIGIEIPEGALERGYGYLAATKMVREECDDVAFRYTMQDRGDALDVRASVARVAPCFFALHAGGKATAKEVEGAIEMFVNRRGELDKVLGYPGNHVGNSFFNSAYYFMWAHYYTARAINVVVKDPAKRKRYAVVIQEALLKHQRPMGTWTDHEAWGQLYGTSMCLMALGELKFAAPGAYRKPVATLEGKVY